MCRLYGFRANEATKVECTLVHAQNAMLLQSRSDLSGESHSDGWGIGYYDDDGRPAVERRATAAFQDVHFSLAAERIFTRSVLAHVRHATVGGLAVENTHPFAHGPWLFAHNGTVTGFEKLRGQLEQETDPSLRAHRHGTTDSEAVFYWLLSRPGFDVAAAEPGGQSLAELVAGGVTELARRCAAARPDQPPRLNILLTNGSLLVATRWNRTLHRVERDDVHDCEICGIPHVRHDPDGEYRAVVIASEPISDENWCEVPDRSLLLVDEELRVRIRPL